MNAEFFLPWPSKALSPNARVHWSALARAKKQSKDFAYYRTIEAGLGKINSNALSVKYTFHPPGRRRFDLDNMLSSMKAAADGIALAVGIDDSKWAITITKAEPTISGAVKVELEWNEEAA